MQQKVLTEGSEAYETWLHIPVPLIVNVYLFNLTNAEEVANGSPVIEVNEIGPYVFQDHRSNIIYDKDEKTITYLPRSLFKFLPERSGNLSLFDEITTVNIPLVVSSPRYVVAVYNHHLLDGMLDCRQNGQ